MDTSGKKKKHPLNICRNSQLILEWRMVLALSEKLASILYVIKGFNYTNRAGPTHKPEKKKKKNCIYQGMPQKVVSTV